MKIQTTRNNFKHEELLEDNELHRAIAFWPAGTGALPNDYTNGVSRRSLAPNELRFNGKYGYCEAKSYRFELTSAPSPCNTYSP